MIKFKINEVIKPGESIIIRINNSTKYLTNDLLTGYVLKEGRSMPMMKVSLAVCRNDKEIQLSIFNSSQLLEIQPGEYELGIIHEGNAMIEEKTFEGDEKLKDSYYCERAVANMKMDQAQYELAKLLSDRAAEKDRKLKEQNRALKNLQNLAYDLDQEDLLVNFEIDKTFFKESDSDDFQREGYIVVLKFMKKL